MKQLFICGAFLLVLVHMTYGQPPNTVRSYQNNNILLNGNNTNYFEIRWTVNETQNIISLAVICTPGPSFNTWCGIGFSAGAAMIGSDAIIGSVDQDGTTALVFDFFLRDKQTPSTGLCPNAVCSDLQQNGTFDCNNDVTNAIGSRSGSYMVLEFQRPLNATDVCDSTIQYATQTQALIWAWGNGLAPLNMAQHVYRDVRPNFNWVLGVSTTGSVPAVTTGEFDLCYGIDCSTNNTCKDASCTLSGGNPICSYTDLVDGTACEVIGPYCYTGTCQSGICNYEAEQVCPDASTASFIGHVIIFSATVLLFML